MPQIVNGSQFISFAREARRVVHRILKTVNYQPLTINRKTKGFTLIELLVVIAIIGILAVLIAFNMVSAQQRARDSRRKGDLDAVAKALELAKSTTDSNSYYPPCIPVASSPCTLDQISVRTSPPQPLNPNFIKSLPQDPLNLSPYQYRYIPTGPSGSCNQDCINFTLRACLENSNDNSQNPPPTLQAPCITKTYEITNP